MSTEGRIEPLHEPRIPSALIELELAILFCEVAAFAEDKTKADRSIENARKAYSEGVRFLFGARLSSETRKEVIDKLALLHAKLRDLDERTILAFEFQEPPARVSRG